MNAAEAIQKCLTHMTIHLHQKYQVSHQEPEESLLIMKTIRKQTLFVRFQLSTSSWGVPQVHHT